MKALLAFITLLMTALTLASCGVIISNHYQIDREVDSWKGRAQVSSEPNDMYEYMSNVKEGMERRGFTSGYADPIFPTSETDMALVYRAVQQHVDQAEVLTTMDRSTPEYQTGLDNLRGSIRELELHTKSYWSWHFGLGWWILNTLSWIFLCVFGFWLLAVLLDY